MNAPGLILAFRGLDLSMFATSQNRTQKSRFLIRCTAVVLAAFLSFPVLASAQEDTLILLGSNSEMYHIRAVSAYNKNAFVTDVDWGLRVINYSDPYNPDTVIRYTGWADDIELKDSLAYYGGECLIIKDISDPLEPDTVGSCCCYANHLFRIHLFDTLALTLHVTPVELCFLIIIDISDPSDPQELSFTGTPTYGTTHLGDAYKKDNYVYWADRTNYPETGRIIVFDITDPTEPVPIVVDTCLQADPHAIWIKDDYAYVTEGYGGRGLMVFDISDPYDIDSVGCFPIPEGRAWNVYIKGNYAYVSAHVQPTLEWNRIYVLDISDPTNPYLVTYHDTPGMPFDVFVDDPYVLVADYTSLLVFEASFLSNVPGDVNSDREVNISDVVYLINYLFRNGPEPTNPNLADVNADCQIELADVVYLINYLYRGGPAPLIGCTD